ncbi:hypothetical protein GOODEAATRI_004069, partial [Goodea atripinnis]
NVLKGVARRASSKLHAAETLFTRYRISFPDGPVAKDWALDKLRALRWAVSEHHDGITGTESPKVAEMYVQHLMQAMMGAEELLAALFLLPHNLGVSGIQRSAQSNATYDLFFVVQLGGLQHRKYSVQFSEAPCSEKSKCEHTYEAQGVVFERRRVKDWGKTGRWLLPVLNDCYKLMFDQDTNLLHSATYL